MNPGPRRGDSLRAKFHRIALLSLFLCGVASASLGVVSLEELTRRAGVIVYGSVLDIESAVFKRDSLESAGKISLSIATVRIKPFRIFKGGAMEPLVVKVIENMEDSPRFQKDQDVFLFLSRNADGTSYSTIGQIQGKFDVIDGMVVRMQTSVEVFIRKLKRLILAQEAD